MKKQKTINTVNNNDDFSSGLMESYGKWMGGDCFQNTDLPDIHLSEAPFDGMDPQSNRAEIEDVTKKKKGPTKKGAYVGQESAPTNEETEICSKCGGSHPTDECPNILEREEMEMDGELYILEKIKVENWDNIEEGSMKQARANVGASTCWKGYKAKGTKMKGGKSVPNCVKEDEFHHQKDKDGNTIPHEDEIQEGKKGLYDNIHAKRKRGEAPAKKGDKGYPAPDAFKKAAKTAKEEVELAEKKLDPVGKEDGDVDNDGDKDKSDKYLLARRKKVSKIIAMSKKK